MSNEGRILRLVICSYITLFQYAINILFIYIFKTTRDDEGRTALFIALQTLQANSSSYIFNKLKRKTGKYLENVLTDHLGGTPFHNEQKNLNKKNLNKIKHLLNMLSTKSGLDVVYYFFYEIKKIKKFHYFFRYSKLKIMNSRELFIII